MLCKNNASRHAGVRLAQLILMNAAVACDVPCSDWLARPSGVESLARAFSESILLCEVNSSIPSRSSYLFMSPGMVSHKIKKLLQAALDPFR